MCVKICIVYYDRSIFFDSTIQPIRLYILACAIPFGVKYNIFEIKWVKWQDLKIIQTKSTKIIILRHKK